MLTILTIAIVYIALKIGFTSYEENRPKEWYE